MPTARPVWSTRRQALALFARGATVRVAGGVGLVVGTILSVTNQGSVIIGGEANWVTWIRVGVNYLTPSVVPALATSPVVEPSAGRPDASSREASLPLCGFHDVMSAHG